MRRGEAKQRRYLVRVRVRDRVRGRVRVRVRVRVEEGRGEAEEVPRWSKAVRSATCSPHSSPPLGPERRWARAECVAQPGARAVGPRRAGQWAVTLTMLLYGQWMQPRPKKSRCSWCAA